MNDSYRNHPSVLIKNVAIPLIVGYLVSMSMDNYLWMIPFIGFAALSAVAWMRTIMEVFDDHLVVTSKIISVKVRTIQYDKVASVNEVKGIFGRMFGWTSLRININSSQNYARPEVIFVLPDADASEIATHIKSSKGFVSEESVEMIENENVPECAPVFSFGLLDAIIFGAFGADTVKIFSAVFWGVIAFISFVYSEEASLLSILMFVTSGIIPIVSNIIRHGNFRVYRMEDRIRLVHGMVTVYDTTFEMSRVNAVCIKRSLFARILGRCCIQAEVVGINAEKNATTPTITMLIPESQLPMAMERLFPEFASSAQMNKQPRGYLNLIAFRTLYLSLSVAAVAVFIASMWTKYEPDSGSLLAVPVCAAVAASIVVIAALYWYLAYRIFELGEDDTFVISRTGVVDISTYVVHYPKVQITSTRASPRARKNGIARCTMSLLSAGGRTKVYCGFFDAEELDGIADRTVEKSGEKLITNLNAGTSACTAD